MALLNHGGFDYFGVTQAAAAGWTGAFSMVSGTNTRYNYGQALNTNQAFGNANKNFGANYGASIFFGVAMQVALSLGSKSPILFAFSDAGTTQIDVQNNPAGAIRVTRNGTQLGGFSTYVLPQSGWIYLEVGIVFHASAGSVTVRVNGVQILNVAGVNTMATANAYCNQLFVGNGLVIDDWYICDSTGADRNNFLGEQRVYTQEPNAAGGSTHWTPNGAASNYLCVSSVPPDATKYVSDSTPGDIDLYALPALPANVATVNGVKLNYYAQKSDAGARTIESVLKSGAAQVTGAPNALGASWLYYADLFADDPATGVAWLAAAVSAMQIGLEEVV